MCWDPEDVSLHVQLKFVEIALQGTSKLGPNSLKAVAYHVFKSACFLVLNQDLLHLVEAILMFVFGLQSQKSVFQKRSAPTLCVRKHRTCEYT
jgi:hypothetical protein